MEKNALETHLERLVALLSRRTLADLDRHHAQELFEVDCAVFIIIHASKHCFEIIFTRLKAEALHGYPKFTHVDAAAAV